MDNNVGDWLFGLIYLLIIVIGWLVRRSKNKSKTPSGPKPEIQMPQRAAELPEDARRLITQAAAARPPGARPGPNPFAGDPVREPIYNELSLRDTEYLLQNWYEDDETQWSDAAFDVMERILIDRLGQLPARSQEEEAEEESLVEPAEDIDPQVRELWAEGDLEGLAHVLRYDPDWIVRMDAAEALAALGDPRGREHLTAALKDPADDVRAVAREILDGLPAQEVKEPVRAPEPGRLQEWMLPQTRSLAQPPAGSQETPARPGDIWAAYRQKQAAFEAEQSARAPGSDMTKSSFLETQAASSAGGSRSVLLKVGLIAGGVGGLLGVLGSYLLVGYLGGSLSPADQSTTSALLLPSACYFPLDVVTGAAAGIVANLLGQAVSRLVGWEATPSDVTPVLASVLGGAAAAMAMNAFFVLVAAF